MAVSPVDLGTSQVGGAADTTTTYTSITISTLTNGALILGALATSQLTGLTIVLNGSQSMTTLCSVRNANISFWQYIFGLRAPASGAASIVLTWTGGSKTQLCAMTFSGVNQASDAAAFPSNVVGFTGSANHNPDSVTVNSAVGDYTFSNFMMGDGANTFTGATSGTQLLLDNASIVGFALTYQAGASPTVTSTATINTTDPCSSLGIDLAASGGPLPIDSSGIGIMRVQPPGYRWNRKPVVGWRRERSILVPDRRPLRAA